MTILTRNLFAHWIDQNINGNLSIYKYTGNPQFNDGRDLRSFVVTAHLKRNIK